MKYIKEVVIMITETIKIKINHDPANEDDFSSDDPNSMETKKNVQQSYYHYLAESTLGSMNIFQQPRRQVNPRLMPLGTRVKTVFIYWFFSHTNRL